MGLRPLALAVGALLLVGCASKVPPTLPIDPGTSTETATATSAAPAPSPADFPVDAVPRPIVLVGPVPVIDDWQGLEQEKLAQGHGYRFTGAEPPTPEPTTVRLPDGPAALPLVGARDALTGLGGGTDEGEPLELVAVELGTATFSTDRGGLELPAWRFRSAFGSVHVWPAVAPGAFWHPGAVRASFQAATTTDGVRLQVELGAPDPPCEGHRPETKEVVVTEGEASVKIGVRVVGGPPGDCAQAAIYREQYYPVTLSKPLGARLLVLEDDTVIPVTGP
ncbi:hypothetical protein AB0425_40010 [Actinosynnema sp. NPDC051121]